VPKWVYSRGSAPDSPLAGFRGGKEQGKERKWESRADGTGKRTGVVHF